MDKFYVPVTGTERVLESGRPLIPGEQVDLTKEEQDSEFNQRLISEGHLRKVPRKKESSSGGDG